MTDMADILLRIRGISEDARFEAWMELYSAEEEAAQNEIDKIISDPDPILKILLCRFLSYVYEEKAVGFLSRLLLDENTVVVEAAKKSFEKNLYDRKLKALQSVLDAPLPAARYFAVEKISVGGMIEMVPKFLKMLKSADQELTLKILTGLRFLPEKILVYELDPYHKSASEDIRFKAVLAYSALFEAGYGAAHKRLLASLKDEAPRIRQTALWALRRRPSRQDLKFLFAMSLNDPDPMVRQESVLNFSAFPTAKVIRHLLSILVNDESRLVVLKGESVLLTMPPRRLIRGLRHNLKSSDRKLSTKAVLLFAEFQRDSRSFYEYVLKSLARAKTPREKLPYLEALGILRQKKAVPVLEKHLNEVPLIAYTAMNSILRIWGRDPAFPALDYLKIKDLPNIIHQMVLKHVLKIEDYPVDDGGLREHLIAILQSDNLNLRYLAAQVLARVPQERIAEPLFTMMLKESDPSSLKLLRDNIGRLLLGNPGLFNLLFDRYRHNAAAVHLLLSFMKDIDLSAAQLNDVLPKLLADTPELLPDNVSSLCDAVFYFLMSHKLRVDELFAALQPLSAKDELLSAVLERLRKNPAVKLRVPIDKVLDDLRTTHRFAKKHMIELLSYSDSSEAISALVSVSCDNDLSSYHNLAAAGLVRMMGLSA